MNVSGQVYKSCGELSLSISAMHNMNILANIELYFQKIDSLSTKTTYLQPEYK